MFWLWLLKNPFSSFFNSARTGLYGLHDVVLLNLPMIGLSKILTDNTSWGGQQTSTPVVQGLKRSFWWHSNIYLYVLAPHSLGFGFSNSWSLLNLKKRKFCIQVQNWIDENTPYIVVANNTKTTKTIVQRKCKNFPTWVYPAPVKHKILASQYLSFLYRKEWGKGVLSDRSSSLSLCLHCL